MSLFGTKRTWTWILIIGVGWGVMSGVNSCNAAKAAEEREREVASLATRSSAEAFDATNGKITYEKMYDTRSPFDSAGLRSDGSTVSFKAAEEAGTFGKKTYVINSATGEVEATAETKNHRWMARVDGVDLCLDSNPNSQQSTGVSTAQWSIPKGGADKLTKANDELSPLTYGQYVNLATEKSPCTIIDVHTGVEAKLPIQGKQMCLGRYNDAVMEKEVARLYFGVLPITTLTMDQYFMNPIKEELVPVTNGDPFQSFFTGGDGYVYGSGGANKKLPARVDLAQGEINVLSSGSGGNVIHAASGDSVIAIPLSDAPTNKGYLFLTPN